MSGLLYYFCEMIKWGFTFSLPLLIAGSILKKNWRVFIKQWLLIAYTLVLSYCFIALVDRTTIFERSDYGFYLFAHIFLLLLLAALFIFKKIRHSFGWGMIALLILHYDIAYTLFWRLYRNYLPSSWSTYYDQFSFYRYVFYFIVFNVLTGAIYFFIQLKRKQMQKEA